jgi:hypothetical protein
MEAIIVPLLASAGASAGTITAATAIGTSGLFSALGALGTVASGVTSVMAGQQQQAMYDLQAQQARLRARSDEIKYRQQGVAALDRTLSTAATIAARAGAGSIDPFSGSAAALTTYAFGKGFGEFNLAQESATLAGLQGDVQSTLYGMSGEQAGMAGYAKGFSNVFAGLTEASKIGGPSTPAGGSLLNYPAANVPLPPTRPVGL